MHAKLRERLTQHGWSITSHRRVFLKLSQISQANQAIPLRAPCLGRPPRISVLAGIHGVLSTKTSTATFTALRSPLLLAADELISIPLSDGCWTDTLTIRWNPRHPYLILVTIEYRDLWMPFSEFRCAGLVETFSSHPWKTQFATSVYKTFPVQKNEWICRLGGYCSVPSPQSSECTSSSSRNHASARNCYHEAILYRGILGRIQS